MNGVKIFFNDEEGIIFFVESDSTPDHHTTAYDEWLGWHCTCEDYTYRKRFCKHMQKCWDYVKAENIPVKVDLEEKVFGGVL